MAQSAHFISTLRRVHVAGFQGWYARPSDPGRARVYWFRWGSDVHNPDSVWADVNASPRRCGNFYKHQIDNISKAGVDMLYTAMFDEFDEGTAIFKAAVQPAELPDGVGMVPLDGGG